MTYHSILFDSNAAISVGRMMQSEIGPGVRETPVICPQCMEKLYPEFSDGGVEESGEKSH